MASISGGDLIEATYNHPSLGTGTFNFMGSEDGTFMLGGFSTADDTAKIDGAGNAIWTMNQKQWTVEGVISWDMNSGGSLKVLQDLTSSTEDSDWTFSSSNGTIYSGKGRPVGDLAGNTGQSTVGFKIAGGGKLSEVS